MTLSNDDHRLLLALWEDPLKPDSQLAAELGVSAPTIKRRLEKLQKERVINAVSIKPYHYSLGMDLVSYLITLPENRLEIFEELLDIHPYTTFRVRVFGGVNGIFVQFTTPIDSDCFLDELFTILKEKKWIVQYQKWNGKQENTINTTLNFKLWDVVENKWNFSVNKFLNNLHNGKIDKKTGTPIIQNVLSEIQILDLILLRELSLMGEQNADGRSEFIKELKLENSIRFKQSEVKRLILELPIYREFLKDIPKEELERKIKHWISEKKKFLDENIIRDYYLAFDRTKVKLFSRILIAGRIIKTKTIENLKASLENKLFPFESGLILSEEDTNKFIWWLNVTPSEIPKILNFFNRECVDLYVMMMDDDNSFGYPIWPGNFDVKSNTWKVNKEYIVDMPLKEISNTN